MSDVEINANEYAELKGRPTKDELQTVESEKAALEQRIKDLEGEVTTEKAAHQTTKDELETKKTELTSLSTEKAAQELKSKRVGSLGDAFLEALPEPTRTLLVDKQAVELDDPAWDERLKELAALTKTATDAKKDGTKVPPAAQPGETQSPDEIASLQVGHQSAADGAPDQDTVLGELAASL